MNKRIISIAMAIIMIFGILAVQAENTVKLVGLTGPTSIGMAGILLENNNSENKYDFEALGTADEVVAKLSSGQADIAAIPLVLASALFNKTEGKLLKALDINTLGVLYLMELGDTIKSLDDLKGKEVFLPGKGTTPEYTFRYLLKQNNIDPDKDLTLTFKSEAAEIVAILKNNPTAIALLPQPFVVIAQTQLEGLRIALDINEEWDKLNNGSKIITGVTVARTAFINENPQAVINFLEDHKNSVEFVNIEVEKAANLIEEKGIFKAAIAKKAIPFSNIIFIDGDDMKPLINNYLKILFDSNPKSVGGALPNADFYAELQK